MRRGLVHTIAWLLATGAATTLTWWGVHTVMAGTAYDPPRALPLPVNAAEEVSAASRAPLDSSTRRPRSPSAPAPTSPSPAPEAPQGGPAASPSTPKGPGPGAVPVPSPSPSAPSGSGSGGRVESYAVDGGRVVLELGSASAELVSATPDAGWQVQVWTEEYWIRVTFTRDGREVSVFCTWHDSPPRVEFDDR
ncbi:hypothetical protein ACIQ7D_09475 [Streptomyces sp. NPDC096310]|uniref:hypothetical protein n=1 Tax=Streptomyces sp. NPDC096310 TaxID=3366082 RepID=UPI0037FDBD9E